MWTDAQIGTLVAIEQVGTSAQGDFWVTVEVKVEVYAREHPQSCARDSEAGARKGGEKGRGDREGR